MAGHSKWANIKRRKGAQDVARGKLFSKLIREITVAAKVGGGDMDANPRLRLAVDKAKSNSMPKATIERAISKGSGEDGDSAVYETIAYEGYGPGGVAILVECLTDNRNRTVAEVRHAFAKGGGNMGNAGSVAYLFQKRGVFEVPVDAVDEDTLMMLVLEAGAEDLQREEESWVVTCALEAYGATRQALEDAELEPTSAQLTQIPDTLVPLEAGDARKLMKLVDRLDDLDDVQDTYTNADFDDSVLD